MRSKYDCILSTSKTVVKDNSLLNCRIAGLEKKSPVRIILDKKLEIPLNSKIINTSDKIKTIIIKGIAPNEGQFWSVFLWNENSLKWEPLNVGADLFSVKSGHIMAWSLVKYDPANPQTPKQLPK